MHELSLILNIVDLATDAVRNAEARQVDVIELDIGQIAGVEPEVFDFAWPVAVKDTVLANAKRIIRDLPAIAECSRCQCRFSTPQRFAECPQCGDVCDRYVQGRELRIKSLVVS